MWDTLLYIGAYTDLVPVLFLKDIKNFIFIDCVPFSKYDNTVALKEEIMTTIYASINEINEFKDVNQLGDKHFLTKLEKVMKQNNFSLIEENYFDSYLLYKNQDRTIKYYINRPFPQFLTQAIVKDMKECNMLYISGHDPDKSVFNFIKRPFTIIGTSNTVFSVNDVEENSTIKYLHTLESEFNKYYFLKMIKEYEWWKEENINEYNMDKYKLVKCNNIRDFNNFKNFV